MDRKPKRWIPAAIAIGLIVVICAVAGFGYIRERYSPSKERVDLNELYQITSAEEAAVIVNHLLTEEKALLRDGEVYLPLPYVTEEWNSRIYVDEKERILSYALPDQVIRITEENVLSDFSFGEDSIAKSAPVWLETESGIYVSITFIQEFTDVSFSFYEEPARLYVDATEGIRQYAVIDEDTELRQLGGIKSPIVADVAAGSDVIILDAMEEWSQIRTMDGWIGYVQNKYLENMSVQELVSDFTEPVYTNISHDYDICLVWHQVFNQSGNDSLEELLKATQGVNTISPTWFSLSDNEGNFTSLASTDYVEKAHAMGLEVWALVDNFSEEMSTYEVLSHTSTRTALIQNLLNAALEYDLDGINIDFEEIKSGTGPHFVQFIRELSVVCRANGIVLSVDNYVPTAWTACYDRKEQGIVADYIIIMGYDEHWGTSDAGSTASLPFVQSGIENTLLEVPQDKVIHALPFYTRVWEFDASAEIAEGADPLSAEYVLKSTAVGMSKAKRLLTEADAELIWQEELGQYYGEYTQEGTLYRIWLEDVQSLKAKLDVVEAYDLAGVAFWKLGLESDDVWAEIAAYIQE